ncbi:hypothetical protein AYL99_12111 [Fonsecaea erecta]|uniref:Uncharacterized protein n=1 Tax=Fonsecaea erecta TaxID=1367422 RepID=A0A178Z1P3_9EURO|nr:hypothetical protein AYL99_12111 [Fonsecaea erecta]OAP53720.1 hypothetical protein AYL99_12111 [Fonsecaea erecta]
MSRHLSEYESAFAQERFTTLLEEHTLGYIDPWESVQIEVVNINKLKQNFDGGAPVTIPTSVAPRYETLSLEVHEVLTDESGVSQFQEKEGLNIEISNISNVAVRKLESFTPHISSEIGSSHTFSDFATPLEPLGFDSKEARVTFTDHTAALEKDFVLTVKLDASTCIPGSPGGFAGSV